MNPLEEAETALTLAIERGASDDELYELDAATLHAEAELLGGDEDCPDEQR